MRLLAREAGLIGNLQAYLFRVAASVLADRARRRAVRATDLHQELQEWDHPVEDISPERVLLGQEAVRAMVAAIETLPPRTRDAFVLHRFEEVTYGAIAARMGISVSAVEKHIMRAMRHLADRLDG